MEPDAEYDKLPEGVKEPQVFDLRHGLNDSPKPETETAKEVTVEDGTTDRETETGTP